MSLNAIARAKFSGAQAVFGKNNETSRVMAGTLPGTYLLLVIQKYPESHTGYNPSLSLSAYEKQAVAATGIKNLEEYANSFKNMSGPHHVRIGPVLKTFGEANGHYLRIEAQFPNATIQQHNYVTETRTFYVVMVASVMDEADGAVLKESASTLMIYDK
jgi:hypothetical protein